MTVKVVLCIEKNWALAAMERVETKPVMQSIHKVEGDENGRGVVSTSVWSSVNRQHRVAYVVNIVWI